MQPQQLTSQKSPEHLRDLVASDLSDLKATAGIWVADPVHRRLMEAATVQLELTAQDLDESSLDVDSLAAFELILADEAIARRIAQILAASEERADRINPAVIAIRSRPADSRPADPRVSPEEPSASSGTPADATPADSPRPAARSDRATPRDDQEFDAVLALPMEPAPIVAQISLVLYAHRTFARRFHSALEELHLNRRIFRSVTSGITVANALLPDLPLTYVNPAFEVMTGYCLEDVQGRNCRFLQGRERDQPAIALLREAIAGQREVTVILKNFRKDGSFFWNELSLSPIRNRSGTLTHFVGIQTDVTARVEFEAALRESEKLAAVGRLASSIAHEINNPLEAVMNLLYLSQRTPEMAEVLRYLAIAEKELQRVSLITSQSLRFYKQSSKPQAVSSASLLEAVLDLYLSRLGNMRITVERRERTESSFVCMESEIRQVLNNLVRNAIDAMGKGGRLVLRTREAKDWRTGSGGVLITVADTGSGIAPEVIKNIYKAFFTTKGIGGTGLGLWISCEIVERHHGRLLVRSRQPRPGVPGGTVFQLFLPYQGITG